MTVSATDAAGTVVAGTPQGAGTTTGGTASGDEAQTKELADLRAQKEQWLGEKTKYEEATRRAEELQNQLDRVPPPTTDAGAEVQQRVRMAYARLESEAAAGNEDAILQLGVIKQLGQTNARVNRELELLRIPEAERDEVDKASNQYGVSPSLARKIMKGEKLEQAEASLREREARLKAEETARAEGRVGTAVTPLPTAQAQEKFIKASEYEAKVDQLRAAGKLAEAKTLIDAVNSGEMKILYNQ